MRQRILIALAVLGVLVALVVGVGAGGDNGGDYRVRAIFDNAAFAIPGEDVMIAGAKVGVVDDLEVTPDKRAAVVLKIDEDGFKDFRKDAECQIRLQSVIGEKLVECVPTQPRPEGEAPPPPLQKIPDGQPGAGQYLLPVSNTVTPVGEDLIRSVMRKPYRERFAIILNEFGAGLAGRGKDLRTVIRKANPALRELDKVLAILARQNKLLSEGSRAGDRVLAEWAKERKSVADAIVKGNIAAQATAEKRAALERNFALFPKFVAQLTPTMQALYEMTKQMTPVATNLNAEGTDISRALVALEPFSKEGIPALRSLGNTADVGTQALEIAGPTVALLGDFTDDAVSLSTNLAKLLTNLRDEDGIKNLMDLIYNITLSTNGYDELGHYLRTTLLAGCNSLATVVNPACTANFIKGANSASAARKPRTALEKIFAGEDPAKVLRGYKRQQQVEARKEAPSQQVSNPAPADQSKPQGDQQQAQQQKQDAAKANPDQAVLDYLLGAEK
jgi:phospholipid/cholesterol/gamma-HCH transport system substrate-binding protein